MSFRTLLVPLFGTESDRAALKAALTFARGFDAHVEALFAKLDPRDAIPVLGEGMSGAMVEEIMKAAETDTTTHRALARRTFDEAVAAAGARFADSPPVEESLTAGWNEILGRAEEVAVGESRLSDLVVFAAPKGEDTGEAVSTLENVLLGSGRPVLYVSDNIPQEIGRRVAVAWNGKPEGARTVALAMPILESAETVNVLTVETAATQAAAGRRLVDYLSWHRINSSLTIMQSSSYPVGRTLMEKAEALGCDLILMGGYGHSRMREMILGGVTRYVFGHPGLPVLMAH